MLLPLRQRARDHLNIWMHGQRELECRPGIHFVRKVSDKEVETERGKSSEP